MTMSDHVGLFPVCMRGCFLAYAEHACEMNTRLVCGTARPDYDEGVDLALHRACQSGRSAKAPIRVIALQNSDGYVYRVVRTAGSWEFHTALIALEKLGFRASWTPTAAQASRFDAVLRSPT
jgi:hypothetical protein